MALRKKGSGMTNGPSCPLPAKSAACSEIRIANRISEIGRVAALVDSFGADHKLSNEVLVALNVSLDEILNNIISYGYQDAGHHEIVVRLELQYGNIDVVVEDDGRPFNPLLAPSPDLTAKPREGGVGLHFVRNLTDQQKYARREGFNQLRLSKKLEQ
jgi:anti-sigma regulatory factor (Ser/Thr protein kinase)